MFSCQNWLTTGSREKANKEIDSNQLQELSYSFYYQQRDQNKKYFLQTVVAVSPETKEFKLQPGDKDHDFFLDITVFIMKVAIPQTRTNYSFSMQVNNVDNFIFL